MKKIIKPKGTGKTTELIKLSHDTWTYILVTDSGRQRFLSKLAKELKIDIPYPVTVLELEHSRSGLCHLKNILIDDADDVLEELLGSLNIAAITMRDGE